jgi:hypothetical protein
VRQPPSCRVLCLASLIACLSVSARAVSDYPLDLTLDANANTSTTAVTSIVTVRVERLMEENRRKRVTDALTYSGYAAFLTALRALPPVGTITVRARTVDVRYAREQPETTGRRLLLVADHPLVFVGGDPAKSRVGYELTVLELHFDTQGGITGTMAGAARVKPSPGGPVLDDYAEAPLRLAVRPSR